MIRAKFLCTGKSPAEYRNIDEGFVIDLIPVYSGSPENEKFFELTPYGNIKIGTVNLDAAAEFEIGKEYYVDFIKTN